MYKAYRFRLYPNVTQRLLINKTFGCTRFIYNYFLDKCKTNKYIKVFDMCNEIKTLSTDYPFLKEVDSCALRCAVFNLEDGFKNFFAKRSDYPKFKSKFNKQTYRTTCIKSSYKGKEYSSIELDLVNKKIKLPKLGLVDIRGYRNLEVINKNVKPTSIVGIDLGIKDLVVTSDGEKYSNSKELQKREKQLKRLQRKLSRQVKESNNYQKTRVKIARVHSKIKNSRKHNMISIVNNLVREHDIIVSEKLNVKKMSSNHNLAKNILDASFNKICEMLKWKCKLHGKYYYQVNTYFPSSKKCSHCENKTEVTSNLSIRNWTCDVCGNENDRDINASINIMFEGLKIHYQN